MLLFSGTTSWFCWVWVCCVLCGVVPPGVIRIVLTAWPVELAPDGPVGPPPPVVCDWHGCTATVWASAPFGTTISLEPAGTLALDLVLPTPPLGWLLDCWLDPCCGQGGTMILTSFRCLARMTVRTPGVWREVEIGSVDADT